VTTGAVVMAYGTPASLDDVEAYYTHVRRGRPPTPEQLADLTERYRALARRAGRSGGDWTSPLRAITEAQAARIGAALGDGWQVALGQKHAPPFIEDAVAALAGAGVDRVVGVVLAPHHSRGSVGEYVARLRAAAAEHGVDAAAVESWHDLPEYVAFLAAAVREGLAALPERTKVLFTAHSLPERVLEGDDYVDELTASATAAAAAAGLDRRRELGAEAEVVAQLPGPRDAGEHRVGPLVDEAAGEGGREELAADAAGVVDGDLGARRDPRQLEGGGEPGDAGADDGVAAHAQAARTRSARASSTTGSSFRLRVRPNASPSEAARSAALTSRS